jgi:protein disulfide-isomerase A6
MVRIPQFLTAALAITGASAASAVKDLLPNNFDDIVLNSGKPALVEFFAPWCGHCKTLAPIYEELASAFEHSDKVTIAKVDADAHKELGRKHGVQGFPTLKWFADGKVEDYKSGRDLESLTAFVQEKTGVKTKTKKAAPSNVEMLNDSTFKEKIGGKQDVLVAFTAPWCGRKFQTSHLNQDYHQLTLPPHTDCKTLAPVWEELAKDFASEPSVLVAKVDCEAPNAKAVAQAAGVKSYPTIKYYPAGSSEAVPYTSGRSEADLVSFLNDKAGTFRVAGGGLNAIAGTIPSLNDIVATLKTGGAKAQEEFEKAVGGAKDQYAEYYGKVAKKSEENSGYVEKELARLQSLLKKGGLTTEKVDDLVRRSNILNVFKGPEEKSEL